MHDDRVVALAVHGLEEHGVGRVRAGGIDARRPRGLDRRGDVLGVLVAEQPVLAGVRVEAADRDPRRVEVTVAALASVSSITSSTRSRRTRSIASRSEQCVLTCVTASVRRVGVSIIVTVWRRSGRR